MTEAELEAGIAALTRLSGQLSPAVLDLAAAALQDRLAQLRSGLVPERQLRQVTVMFVDVVGSTAISGELDPEDIQGLMDVALARFTHIVQRSGGRVLQYAGDGLLAAWGTQASREDDAVCAVGAGLDILAEVPRSAAYLRQRHGLAGFNARVGLHTGPVLLGGGVDGDNTIRGVSVSLAARMEQHAPPGGLRISAATQRLVQGWFELQVQPPIHIKGSAEPVASALVLRRRPRHLAQAQRGLRDVATPLVGRAAELGRLQAAWASLHGPVAGLQVLVLQAEPGMGKTRLLQHWAAWAQGPTQSQNTVWLHGRATPATEQQPHALLWDLLADGLGLNEHEDAPERGDGSDATPAPTRLNGDDPTASGEAIDARSERFAALVAHRLQQADATLSPERAHDQAELLGHLLGLGFAHSAAVKALAGQGSVARSRAWQAARTLLVALARAQPMLLLLEDLHWADADTLAFLQTFLQEAADLPVCLLATTRPEGLARLPQALRATAQVLPLGALDPHSDAALAQALLAPLGESAPEALLSLLRERAAGNPYFMEELVQMLLDSGVIEREAEPGAAVVAWRFRAEHLHRAQALPSSLEALLQARLQQLPPAAEAALKAAAVAGLEFEASLWRALDARAHGEAALLEARGLLRPAAHSAEPAAPARWRFGHQLMQQAAYSRLLKAERRLVHGRAADWYAERAQQPSDAAASAAGHYEAAERADDCARYSQLAAEHYAQRHAHAEVVQQAGRALRLLPREARQARWQNLLLRQRALRVQGQAQAQGEDLAALEELAQRQGDAVWRATAALRRVAAAAEGGLPAQAAREAPAAVALAEAAADDLLWITAHSVWASASLQVGELDTAQAASEAGLQRARRIGARAEESELLGCLSGVATLRGDIVLSQSLLGQALQIDRELGNTLGEANGLINLGVNALQGGDFDHAAACLDEAERAVALLGRRRMRISLALNRSALALARSAAPEAHAQAEQALAMARAEEHAEYSAFAQLSLGSALLALGQRVAAREAFEAARSALQAIGLGDFSTEATAGIAQAWLEEGHTPAASEQIELLLQHLEGGGDFAGTERPLRIWLTLVQVLHACQHPQATAWTQRAAQSLHSAAAAWPPGPLRERFFSAHAHHAQLRAMATTSR
jgi:class 3 adenylate cyclase